MTSKAHKILFYLKIITILFLLNFPVNPFEIRFNPDIRDFTQKKCRLIADFKAQRTGRFPTTLESKGNADEKLDPKIEEYIQQQVDAKVQEFFGSDKFQQMLSTHLNQRTNQNGPGNPTKDSSSGSGEDQYTDDDLIKTRQLMEEAGASSLHKIDKRLMGGYVPALKMRKRLLVQKLEQSKGAKATETERLVQVLSNVSPLPEPARQGKGLLQGKFKVLTSLLNNEQPFASAIPFEDFLKDFGFVPETSQAQEDLKGLGDIILDGVTFEFSLPLNELDEEDFDPEKLPLNMKASHFFSGQNNLDGEVFLSGNLDASSCGTFFTCTDQSFSIVLKDATGEIKKIFKSLGFKSILNVWRPKKSVELSKTYTVGYLDQDMLIMSEQCDLVDSQEKLIVCTKQES